MLLRESLAPSDGITEMTERSLFGDNQADGLGENPVNSGHVSEDSDGDSQRESRQKGVNLVQPQPRNHILALLECIAVR